MRVCVIALCCVLFTFDISFAHGDVVVLSPTSRQKYTYTAKLPGEWTQVPAVSGTQLTYALTWGTSLARPCTFRSDDVPPNWDISSEDKARNFSNSILYALRSQPKRFLHDLRERVPNISLENFYTTYGDDNVKLTLVYSYDDSGMISSKQVSVRSIVYETQLFAAGVFVQVTCNMLRDSYDVNNERLFRNIRDSLAVFSR